MSELEKRPQADTPISSEMITRLRDRGQSRTRVFLWAMGEVARRITEISTNPMNPKAVDKVASKGAEKRMSEAENKLLRRLLEEKVNGNHNK